MGKITANARRRGMLIFISIPLSFAASSIAFLILISAYTDAKGMRADAIQNRAALNLELTALMAFIRNALQIKPNIEPERTQRPI